MRPGLRERDFTAYPATITVFRPRRVGGYEVFTRMTTTYSGARPPYPGFRRAAVTYRLQYQASGPSFFWSIPLS